MARMTVKNPTRKAKAVREAGGLTIIKSGGKATVDANWSETYVAQLEKAGLQIKAQKGGDEKPEEPTVAAEPSRDAALRAAIEGLGDDDYTADGKPEVTAINAALPVSLEPVDAAERDAVWKSMS